MRIVIVRFIGGDDEQAVFLEKWALDERIDVGLEPSVRGGDAAIMRIVLHIQHSQSQRREATNTKPRPNDS